MSDGIKYKYIEVKNIIKEYGYELLSDKYVNARTKLSIKDIDGYKYQITLSNLMSNKTPQKVSPNNIYSIENIKHYIITNKLDVELISNNYNNSTENLIFKCSCGKIFNVSYSKFINRNKIKCNDCNIKISANNRKHNLDFVKLKFIEYGYVPLFDSYETCEHKLKCMNADGYIGFLSYVNLTHGYTFAVFKMDNPYIVKNMQNYILINNITSKLLSETLNSYYDKLLFKCDCGNTYSTTWSSFMDQQIFRCPTCSRKKSSLAIITEDFLKELNVEFECEVKFEDCIDKSYLFFDYKIITSDNNCIVIEVDGQMHFKAGYNKELGLYNQQRRDKIKDNYCKNNNIKLIRIPYWEYDNDNYKEIIKKGLKNIITTH